MDTAQKQQLLKKEILDDAQKRADTIIKRAERDAKKAQTEADEQAKALVQQAVERANADAALDAKRILASVPLEKTRRRLAAQEALVDQALSSAVRSLAGQEGEERLACLTRLLVQAAAAIGDAELVVRCAEKDRGHMESACHRAAELLSAQGKTVHFQADAQAAEISGGVVVRTPAGHKQVDNSFEARRDRLEPLIRLELVNTLFPQDAAP